MDYSVDNVARELVLSLRDPSILVSLRHVDEDIIASAVYQCWVSSTHSHFGSMTGAGVGSSGMSTSRGYSAEDILRAAMGVSDSVAMLVQLLWLHCVSTGALSDPMVISNCLVEMRQFILERVSRVESPVATGDLITHLIHLIDAGMLCVYPHSSSPNDSKFRSIAQGASTEQGTAVGGYGGNTERLVVGSSGSGGDSGSSCDVLLELVAVVVQCLGSLSEKTPAGRGSSIELGEILRSQICGVFRAMLKVNPGASVLPLCTLMLELIGYCDKLAEIELQQCISCSIDQSVGGGSNVTADFELLLRVCFKFLEARVNGRMEESESPSHTGSGPVPVPVHTPAVAWAHVIRTGSGPVPVHTPAVAWAHVIRTGSGPVPVPVHTPAVAWAHVIRHVYAAMPADQVCNSESVVTAEVFRNRGDSPIIEFFLDTYDALVLPELGVLLGSDPEGMVSDEPGGVAPSVSLRDVQFLLLLERLLSEDSAAGHISSSGGVGGAEVASGSAALFTSLYTLSGVGGGGSVGDSDEQLQLPVVLSNAVYAADAAEARSVEGGGDGNGNIGTKAPKLRGRRPKGHVQAGTEGAGELQDSPLLVRCGRLLLGMLTVLLVPTAYSYVPSTREVSCPVDRFRGQLREVLLSVLDGQRRSSWSFAARALSLARLSGLLAAYPHVFRGAMAEIVGHMSRALGGADGAGVVEVAGLVHVLYRRTLIDEAGTLTGARVETNFNHGLLLDIFRVLFEEVPGCHRYLLMLALQGLKTCLFGLDQYAQPAVADTTRGSSERPTGLNAANVTVPGVSDLAVTVAVSVPLNRHAQYFAALVASAQYYCGAIALACELQHLWDHSSGDMYAVLDTGSRELIMKPVCDPQISYSTIYLLTTLEAVARVSSDHMGLYNSVVKSYQKCFVQPELSKKCLCITLLMTVITSARDPQIQHSAAEHLCYAFSLPSLQCRKAMYEALLKAMQWYLVDTRSCLRPPNDIGRQAAAEQFMPSRGVRSLLRAPPSASPQTQSGNCSGLSAPVLRAVWGKVQELLRGLFVHPRLVQPERLSARQGRPAKASGDDDCWRYSSTHVFNSHAAMEKVVTGGRDRDARGGRSKRVDWLLREDVRALLPLMWQLELLQLRADGKPMLSLLSTVLPIFEGVARAEEDNGRGADNAEPLPETLFSGREATLGLLQFVAMGFPLIETFSGPPEVGDTDPVSTAYVFSNASMDTGSHTAYGLTLNHLASSANTVLALIDTAKLFLAVIDAHTAAGEKTEADADALPECGLDRCSEVFAHAVLVLQGVLDALYEVGTNLKYTGKLVQTTAAAGLGSMTAVAERDITTLVIGDFCDLTVLIADQMGLCAGQYYDRSKHGIEFSLGRPSDYIVDSVVCSGLEDLAALVSSIESSHQKHARVGGAAVSGVDGDTDTPSLSLARFPLTTWWGEWHLGIKEQGSWGAGGVPGLLKQFVSAMNILLTRGLGDDLVFSRQSPDDIGDSGMHLPLTSVLELIALNCYDLRGLCELELLGADKAPKALSEAHASEALCASWVEVLQVLLRVYKLVLAGDKHVQWCDVGEDIADCMAGEYQESGEPKPIPVHLQRFFPNGDQLTGALSLFNCCLGSETCPPVFLKHMDRQDLPRGGSASAGGSGGDELGSTLVHVLVNARKEAVHAVSAVASYMSRLPPLAASLQRTETFQGGEFGHADPLYGAPVALLPPFSLAPFDMLSQISIYFSSELLLHFENSSATGRLVKGFLTAVDLLQRCRSHSGADSWARETQSLSNDIVAANLLEVVRLFPIRQQYLCLNLLGLVLGTRECSWDRCKLCLELLDPETDHCNAGGQDDGGLGISVAVSQMLLSGALNHRVDRASPLSTVAGLQLSDVEGHIECMELVRAGAEDRRDNVLYAFCPTAHLAVSTAATVDVDAGASTGLDTAECVRRRVGAAMISRQVLQCMEQLKMAALHKGGDMDTRRAGEGEHEAFALFHTLFRAFEPSATSRNGAAASSLMERLRRPVAPNRPGSGSGQLALLGLSSVNAHWLKIVVYGVNQVIREVNTLLLRPLLQFTTESAPKTGLGGPKKRRAAGGNARSTKRTPSGAAPRRRRGGGRAVRGRGDEESLSVDSNSTVDSDSDSAADSESLGSEDEDEEEVEEPGGWGATMDSDSNSEDARDPVDSDEEYRPGGGAKGRRSSARSTYGAGRIPPRKRGSVAAERHTRVTQETSESQPDLINTTPADADATANAPVQPKELLLARPALLMAFLSAVSPAQLTSCVRFITNALEVCKAVAETENGARTSADTRAELEDTDSDGGNGSENDSDSDGYRPRQGGATGGRGRASVATSAAALGELLAKHLRRLELLLNKLLSVAMLLRRLQFLSPLPSSASMGFGTEVGKEVEGDVGVGEAVIVTVTASADCSELATFLQTKLDLLLSAFVTAVSSESPEGQGLGEASQGVDWRSGGPIVLAHALSRPNTGTGAGADTGDFNRKITRKRSLATGPRGVYSRNAVINDWLSEDMAAYSNGRKSRKLRDEFSNNDAFVDLEGFIAADDEL